MALVERKDEEILSPRSLVWVNNILTQENKNPFSFVGSVLKFGKMLLLLRKYLII